MKKIIVACFAALLLVFGGKVSSAQADAKKAYVSPCVVWRRRDPRAYAPFNWTWTMTQTGRSNRKVLKKQYANMMKIV